MLNAKRKPAPKLKRITKHDRKTSTLYSQHRLPLMSKRNNAVKPQNRPNSVVKRQNVLRVKLNRLNNLIKLRNNPLVS